MVEYDQLTAQELLDGLPPSMARGVKQMYEELADD